MAAKIEKYIKASSGLPVPVIWYNAAKNIVPQINRAAGFVNNPTKTSIAQTDSEKAAKKPNIGLRKSIPPRYFVTASPRPPHFSG